jgi:hypothetical protein
MRSTVPSTGAIKRKQQRAAGLIVLQSQQGEIKSSGLPELQTCVLVPSTRGSEGTASGMAGRK